MRSRHYTTPGLLTAFYVVRATLTKFSLQFVYSVHYREISHNTTVSYHLNVGKHSGIKTEN
jgi:hypothetical protein